MSVESFDGQPELFDVWKPTSSERRWHSPLIPKTSVTLHLGYEHITLIAVGLLMSVLASFALGFDHGQQMARHLPDEPATPAELIHRRGAPDTEHSAPHQQVAPRILAARTTVPIAQAKPAKRSGSRYAIQIASYRKESDAAAETTRLKRSGHSTVSMATKGAFTIVLVGPFGSKTEAAGQLPRWRKQYKDCFVKELPHESTS